MSKLLSTVARSIIFGLSFDFLLYFLNYCSEGSEKTAQMPGTPVPGLWKYHARLVRLVHFHSGQVENFYLLVLGQVQMNKVNTILYIVFHIFINYYELCWIETVWFRSDGF